MLKEPLSPGWLRHILILLSIPLLFFLIESLGSAILAGHIGGIDLDKGATRITYEHFQMPENAMRTPRKFHAVMTRIAEKQGSDRVSAAFLYLLVSLQLVLSVACVVIVGRRKRTSSSV